MRVKREKKNKLIAKAFNDDKYVMYDNAIYLVLAGCNVGKFFCYVGEWPHRKKKISLEYSLL